MKRLIDEEDAIRAVCKNCYAEDGGDYKDCRYYPCDDVQAIEALPSTDLERIKAIMKKANEQDKQMGRQTDLIRRADAIEAVKETLSGNVYWDYVCDALKALKALPSASYEQVSEPQVAQAFDEMFKEANEYLGKLESAEAVQGEWIPCSERLPLVGGEFLVTLVDNDGTWVSTAQWNMTFGGRWQDIFPNDGYRDISNVIAWMPLPKPYREDGEE